MPQSRIISDMLQLRQTEAYWRDSIYVLSPGQIGFAYDTYDFRIGDGINVWKDLPIPNKAKYEEIILDLDKSARELNNKIEANKTAYEAKDSELLSKINTNTQDIANLKHTVESGNLGQIAQLTEDVTALYNELSNKVDKVSGRGLSEANFTNSDKTKLDNIDNKQFQKVAVVKSDGSRAEATASTKDDTVSFVSSKYIHVNLNSSTKAVSLNLEDIGKILLGNNTLSDNDPVVFAYDPNTENLVPIKLSDLTVPPEEEETGKIWSGGSPQLDIDDYVSRISGGTPMMTVEDYDGRLIGGTPLMLMEDYQGK